MGVNHHNIDIQSVGCEAEFGMTLRAVLNPRLQISLVVKVACI